jgi:hypothetical protein
MSINTGIAKNFPVSDDIMFLGYITTRCICYAYLAIFLHPFIVIFYWVPYSVMGKTRLLYFQ